MKLYNKKILAVLLVSSIFLIFGMSLIKAAGLCEPCDGTACDSGLTCERGRCRGCPAAPGVVVICNPLQACDFEEIINSIINFIFYVAIALSPFMIIIGAFYLLTSGGEPRRIDTGKKIILYTLIGFAIVLLAKGIMNVIEQILGI